MNIPQPHDIEAEKGLLSSAMQDPRVISKITDQITIGHFYNPAHQTIWSAINQMWLDKKPVDMLTIISSLRSSGELDGVGGDAYIAELYTIVYTSVNWDFYFETINDCFLRRKILSTCQRMMNDAVDRTKNPTELQELASKEIVSMASTKTDVKSIGEVLNSCINRWEEAAATGGAVNRGHSSGFLKWDMATRGFRPRTLHIIAGAAKAGKTTSSLQMVTNSALHNNIPVAIISMEMAAEELVDKYIAATSQVALGDLLDGKLKNEDHKRLSMAIAKSSRLPIYIVDEASMTVSQFKARCRRLVTEKKVDIWRSQEP
jgi:replicative DNA helicase